MPGGTTAGWRLGEPVGDQFGLFPLVPGEYRWPMLVSRAESHVG
jgi:hypothetical protein